MTSGLVLGKFLPFHRGHAALIDFARAHCDELTVMVCSAASEDIPGAIRQQWLTEYYDGDSRVFPVLVQYDESILPNTSEPSREVAQKWAGFIRRKFPPFDIIFSSEPYGDFLAEFLGAKHLSFDPQRSTVPISASLIRQAPFKFWEFLPPPVRPYFVKKVVIVGTESTGKSVLTERLADRFGTIFVPEMAREIIENTDECTTQHLEQIAELHARTIIEFTIRANKLLFIDTDVNITRSYCRFLFGREFEVPGWIDLANRGDLYLYLENDFEFVQDGSRLDRKRRDLLDLEHRKIFEYMETTPVSISGTWDEKFNRATAAVIGRFDLPAEFINLSEVDEHHDSTPD